MTPEEIRDAAARQLLQIVEEVDPTTAMLESGYLVVSDRTIMPLDGVSWSIDRSSDLPITDEHGVALGTLCLVSDKAPYPVEMMTRWQYSAYLADCDLGSVRGDTHQFTRDYAVIDASEAARYMADYLNGSALWGGFHHGTAVASYAGWKQEIIARRNVFPPTEYHRRSFMLTASAGNPQEQYLKTYHTIELLFDYVTFRKIVKAGDDLVGFGKVMASYQKSELDKLKSIIKEYCDDIGGLASKIVALVPYLDRAEEMFQIHTKEGNPLNGEGKWDKFCALARTGVIDFAGAKGLSLVGRNDVFDEMILNLSAYFVYRVRSSIAHSRIGEYVISENDNEFICRFGLPLIEEVAIQIFSGENMATLIR